MREYADLRWLFGKVETNEMGLREKRSGGGPITRDQRGRARRDRERAIDEYQGGK